MKKSSLLLLSMLCASVALAEPPAPPPTKTQQAASALVNKRLVRPLKKAESRRSGFSRVAPVPKERRVRVLDTEAQKDVHGKQFVRFAIDMRRLRGKAAAWETDVLLGCAYLDQHEVFVQYEEDYFPASSALGEDEEPQPDVCRAAPQNGAQVASAAS